MTQMGIDDQIRVSAEAMLTLVFNYPASDGMRQLEQRLTTVVARGLRRHLETRRPVRIGPAAVTVRSLLLSAPTRSGSVVTLLIGGDFNFGAPTTRRTPILTID
jgi:hypothetical protein